MRASEKAQLGTVLQDNFLFADTVMENADQVLVIRDGEIVERGTHRSLLVAKGFYYQLYMNMNIQ